MPDTTTRDFKVYYPPHDVPEPAFSENNIPVFFGCDDRFLPHVMVVIASIMEHASADNNYDLLVLVTGVGRERMAVCLDWMRRYPNASLRFIDIERMVEEAGRGNFKATKMYSAAIYFRFFAPTVFAKYDKITYQDGDVLFFDDVACFFKHDMQGMLIAGCHDYISENLVWKTPEIEKFWREQLGKEPGDSYFCSGGVVMDLAKMRERESEKALIEKMYRIEGSNLFDQDVMNAVFHKQVSFIDTKWNCLDWMASPAEESLNYDLLDERGLRLVREAREDIKVLHYAERKPWTVEYIGDNEGLYWRYAKMSPFYDEVLAALNADCGFFGLAKKYLVLALQTWNFGFRKMIAGASGRAKNARRLHLVRQRKKAILKQMRRMGYFGMGDGKSDPLRPVGEMAVVMEKENDGNGK